MLAKTPKMAGLLFFLTRSSWWGDFLGNVLSRLAELAGFGRFFIDAKDHIKLKRRIIRDKSGARYDLMMCLYRYEMHVDATYEKCIKAFQKMKQIFDRD